MGYVRKTRDVYDIEGYYAQGWEVECSEDTLPEAQARVREYRANVPGTAYRIRKRREQIKPAKALYRIVRNYENTNRAPADCVRRRGLTLEQAQAHCKNPETSSHTCTSAEGRAHTEAHGPWFDGYEVHP